MKDFGLKLSCWILGYNYNILKYCTEASAKTVRKYVSALIVISILWFLTGYNFYNRYLHGSSYSSIFAGLIMVVTIVMIERQIILTIGKPVWANVFRIFIGVVMAIIGSVIIDQVLFKDDIEKQKTELILKKVEQLLPSRTREIDSQISDLNSFIALKEKERSEIQHELDKKPFISLPQYQQSVVKDTSGKSFEKTEKSIVNVTNPKFSMLSSIDTLITRARDQKSQIEGKRANLRRELEQEIKAQQGFLDELLILKDIVFSSWITGIIYLLLFLFLVSIESLILIIKSADEENDYDLTVKYQMHGRKEILKQLFEHQNLQNNKMTTV